jgi:thiosulfate/3-mercaptopyruvate sulfurtransferase
VTIRLVDCSPADDYRDGHLPGAVRLDRERDLTGEVGDSSRGRHPLPTAERFASAASRAGIGATTFVLAYDGGDGWAQRLWWLLRHFGHDDVGVLADGIDSWLGPLSAGDEAVEPAVFEPRPRVGDAVDAEEIATKLRDPAVAFVDARVPTRFRGEPNPVDRVPGRIPGAVNMPWNGDGEVPPALLEADELVVYCGSGVTACVALLALARAGRPDAKLYPGSWSDWESRGLPVERG